jgi:hypothetical protein
MISFRNEFNAFADKLQNDIDGEVVAHLANIGETLDIIRSENVAQEAERNPEFRIHVRDATQNAILQLEQLQGVFR